MPGINSSAPRCDCCETAYDRFQHYFYDRHDFEEDFYKSTAPSEDIWKKFELLPTPPLSPLRTVEDGITCHSTGEKLESVSHLLGQDEEHESQYKIESEKIFGNVSSIIIQDCMWSGISTSQRLHSDQVSSSDQTWLPITVRTDVTTGDANEEIHRQTAEWVDPGAVLTYPFTNSGKKPTSCGPESRADSSENEEEIDVVTVESKRQKVHTCGHELVMITVRAKPHKPGTKHFHVAIHRQQHNYAAPSPDSDFDDDPDDDLDDNIDDIGEQPNRKRTKLTSTGSGPEHRLSLDSPHSSDSEDADKRRNHNFLERKRRNDLRSRFLALRDQIPSLMDCPKTPKVVILTRACQYLQKLQSSQWHHVRERKRLQSRREQLIRKLNQLKGS